MESRFLEPYRLGRPMIIAGKTVSAFDLERIQIFETQYDSNYVNEEIRARDRASNTIRLVDTHGRHDPVILSQHGVDVTRSYIKGTPGYGASQQAEPTEGARPATNAREVFVVHGRNLKGREALFDFLRAIDLYPLEWSEAVAATGKPSPYIGEILDAVFSRAHAVVVLFTPDDEARLKRPFQDDSDPPHETQLTGQARPNVLFEAGMAMARSQDRTILVELGNLRPYSDIGGRHTLRLDNSTQRRQELAKRLQAAGCPVKLDGIGWHDAGDFQAALDQMVQEASGSNNVDEQQSRTSEYLPLSEDAKELLIEAAKDKQGIVYAIRTLGGTRIATNGNEFGDPGNRREEARWEQAIQDLLNRDLVRPLGTEGEAFEVTHKGFLIADELGTSRNSW